MSQNNPYPDADGNTLKQGREYEDFIYKMLDERYGVKITPCLSKEEQYAIGENYQGFEIKHDSWSSTRRKMKGKEQIRLSIETEEKTRADNLLWSRSGIFRNDNTSIYIHGDYNKAYVFLKSVLQQEYKELKNNGTIEEHQERGTVRAFYLYEERANQLALFTMDF